MLLILLFALIGAVGSWALRALDRPIDLCVWVFDPSHVLTYTQPSGDQPSLVESYRQQSGQSVEVKLIPARALDARLLSLTLSAAQGETVPDLVEIEIGSVGKYLASSSAVRGLWPLDEFLRTDPAAADLLPTRLATWSADGHVFGIPRDVHPVSLSYRADLFAEAGVDLSAVRTWSDFREKCLQYQQYFAARGIRRRALQLGRWTASDLMIMLHQQRIELIDRASMRPTLSDPRIAATIAFYTQLVAGPDAIAAPISDSHFVRDLADGHTAALLTPDWRISYLRAEPTLAGKLRMIHLPRFSPTDAPTASWGGTMIGIPRNCRDPRVSWALLRHLQLSPDAIRARQAHSSILPAMARAWSDPSLDVADSLYGGQPTGRLYAQLAAELPAQRSSPWSTLIAQSISSVLAAAQDHLATHGESDLESFCRQRLIDAERHLQRMVDFADGREQPS